MTTAKASIDTAQPSRFRSTVLPMVVLLIGIPVAFGMYLAVENAVMRVNQLQFDREAKATNSILEIRLQSYSHILYALRAQFASERPVDRAQFRRFVQSLNIDRRYPRSVLLNFAVHVPADGRDAFEASVRADKSINRDGYPKFAVKPPGKRPEYFVIVYLEPMVGDEFPFGLDLGANPMALDPEKVAQALRDGRDSGNVTASAQPLYLKIQQESVHLGLRLAVYQAGKPVDTVDQRRQAYLGSVGAAFGVETLFREALGDGTMRHMRCHMYDLGLISRKDEAGFGEDRRLLFDTGIPPGPRVAGAAAEDPGTHFVYRERVEFADRVWEFEYSANKSAMISGLDKSLAPVALGSGLLVTLLLFGIVRALSTSQRRAVAIASDITRDLRDSETGLAEAQRIAQLGNWALDPATFTMTWSAEAYRLLGVPPASGAVPYAVFLQQVHPGDRDAVDKAIRSFLAGGKDGDIEHRITMGDGSVRWVHTVAKPGTRNRLGHVPGIVMDITARKQAADDLIASHEQLQALSRRLVDIQESERRQFSRELHDVVGQNLTALSINLDIVRTQIEAHGNDVALARLADSSQLLQTTTEAIENVMSEMRPPMLDDYGLLPALKWYAKQFAARTGVQVKVQGDEHMQRLTPAAEIALFRVAQEALNNVAKHARARQVEVCIERGPAQCVMSVTDDGEGFSAAAAGAPRRRPGLGMVTMRERMQAIGGTIRVEGMAGAGTCVELRVPC